MPYVAEWDALNGVMVVGGTLTPAELPRFLEALARAARGNREGREGPANWHRPFLWLVKRDDQYVRAIRLWRCVTRMGLKEAKDYVDSLRNGAPGPTGFEYPDVDETDLSPMYVPREAFLLD